MIQSKARGRSIVAVLRFPWDTAFSALIFDDVGGTAHFCTSHAQKSIALKHALIMQSLIYCCTASIGPTAAPLVDLSIDEKSLAAALILVLQHYIPCQQPTKSLKQYIPPTICPATLSGGSIAQP